jgi:NodT family efflux transporter outer membrane factor (OMF) lipoprotein
MPQRPAPTFFYGSAKWASLWSVVALAACATPVTPPEEVLDITVPATWAGGDPGRYALVVPVPTDLAQWWLRFNDPVLTTHVTQALAANTRVASAQAALRQAQALRGLAAAALSPTLAGSASAQRSETNTGGTGTGTAATTGGSSVSTGLNAAWQPDLSGGLRLGLAAADAAALASAATLGDAQVAVAAEVALTYITLRSGQARLAIARANLANQLETLQITRWRYQAGLLTVLDTEQARAAAEQTRALLPPLQTGVTQARHALAVLMAGNQITELDVPDIQAKSANSISNFIPQADADGTLDLPAQTLLQRPSVVAARHQVDAARARMDQAHAAGLPSVKLSGSLGLTAATLGALGSGAPVLRAVLASISLPLLDGGAISAQVRAQRAAWQQAHQAYKAAVLTTLQEVEDQLAALQGDRERLLHLTAAADAATQAATLARQRYESGLADFQTVLETQRNRLSTQDGVATAQAAISADQVRLFRALGGGWVPGPTPPKTTTPHPL